MTKVVSRDMPESVRNPVKTSTSETNTVSADATLISNDTKTKFEEFLKSKGNQVTSSNSKAAEIISGKDGGAKENLVAVPPPCVHMNGCGPNSLKSSRVFKSLENLLISDDSSAVSFHILFKM